MSVNRKTVYLVCHKNNGQEGIELIYDFSSTDSAIYGRRVNDSCEVGYPKSKYTYYSVDENLDDADLLSVYYPNTYVDVPDIGICKVKEALWDEDDFSRYGVGQAVFYSLKDQEDKEHIVAHADISGPCDAPSTESTQEVKKESKMATSKIAQVTAANTSALKVAAKVEAGSIAINRIVKMVTPKMPMMMRGYMETPFARVAVANMFHLAVQQYAAQNDKAQLVAEAMMEGAMLEMIKSFNIEEMINGVLDGIDVSKFSTKGE